MPHSAAAIAMSTIPVERDRSSTFIGAGYPSGYARASDPTRSIHAATRGRPSTESSRRISS